MSLSMKPIGPVPEASPTARVARAVFPRGTRWMRARRARTLDEDAGLRPLFSTRGRLAEAPWRLACV